MRESKASATEELAMRVIFVVGKLWLAGGCFVAAPCAVVEAAGTVVL